MSGTRRQSTHERGGCERALVGARANPLRSESMHLSIRYAALLALAITTSLASGCATSSGPAETGTVEIPLQQPGPDGALYHLSAHLQIIGPGYTRAIDATDASPSITLELPPGITTVQLVDGWTLSRSVDGGASFVPVQAILASQNPAALRVRANISDTIVFQFFLRDPNGQVTISFGVGLHPLEIAGGLIIATGTGDYAPYANKRPDYAIYHDVFALSRVTLPDGTKDLVVTAGSSATEIFNDQIGLLQHTVAPALSGAFLEYHVAARPDGTQEVSGLIDAVVSTP